MSFAYELQMFENSSTDPPSTLGCREAAVRCSDLGLFTASQKLSLSPLADKRRYCRAAVGLKSPT